MVQLVAAHQDLKRGITLPLDSRDRITEGIVTRTTKQSNSPSLVRYKASIPIEPADVNSLPCFPQLFRSQGSFGFGLNAIKDPDIVDQLERYAKLFGKHSPRITEMLHQFNENDGHSTSSDGRKMIRSSDN